MSIWVVILLAAAGILAVIVTVVALATAKGRLSERVKSLAGNNRFLRRIQKGQNEPLPTDDDAVRKLMDGD